MHINKETGLSLKETNFCEQYIIDFNGTAACIRSGYSKRSATVQATRMLAKANIQAYIKVLQTKLSENTEITANMVLQELAKVGFSNIQDYIKKGFKIENIADLKKEHAAAIESVQIESSTKNGLTITKAKIRLHDKIAALDKIGKHLGFFKADNEQANKVILPDTDLSQLTNAELDQYHELLEKSITRRKG